MKKIYSLLLLCPTAAISEMAIPPTLFFLIVFSSLIPLSKTPTNMVVSNIHGELGFYNPLNKQHLKSRIY